MLYLAATLIVLGVAIFVAAPMLFETSERRAVGPSDELTALEHDRALAIAALRELEFDHEMNKLSDADSAELRTQLESRALSAMASIEALTVAARARPPIKSATSRSRSMKVAQTTPPQIAAQARFRFCPDCGAHSPSSPTANFCPGCGRALASMEQAS